MAKTPAPAPVKTPSPEGRVTNTRPTFVDLPHVKGFPAYRIAPGASENLPGEYLDALDRAKEVRPGEGWWAMMQKRDYLRVTRAPSELAQPQGTRPPLALVEYAEPAALRLVAVESSVETLRQWYGADRRTAVRDAVTARLAMVTPPPLPTSAPAQVAPPATPPSQAPRLSKVPDTVALAVVASETSREILSAWLDDEEETRGPVQEAIQARLQALAGE